MRRLLACVGIGTFLLLVWITVRTLKNLENELASLRRQVMAQKEDPSGQQGSRRQERDATATLSIEPDISFESNPSPEDRFKRISFFEGKMEFESGNGNAAVRVIANP